MRRKRVTVPGLDGSRYSLTGKRIGRPRIDRGNTRCHECLVRQQQLRRFFLLSFDKSFWVCLSVPDACQ